MRPVRPGFYEPDLAAVARLRRRIASDVDQTVTWKRAMLKHCDALHEGIKTVVTEHQLRQPGKRKRPRRKGDAREAEG